MLPPRVDRLRGHAVLLRDLRYRPLIGLAQNLHHLFFGKSGLLHGFLVTLEAILSRISWSEKRRAGHRHQ
jgi:hypothetical protein